MLHSAREYVILVKSILSGSLLLVASVCNVEHTPFSLEHILIINEMNLLNGVQKSLIV